MSVFSWLREKRRDKTMDEFCTHLPSLGIDARVAPRGRPEEEIYNGLDGSLGVIDIVEGPIRWVNVTWVRRSSVALDTGWVDTRHALVYGVPDPKVRSGFPKVRVEATYVEHFITGRVNGVRWEGEDFGLGIVQHLNQNIARAFLASLNASAPHRSFEIRAYPEHGCWTLTLEQWFFPSRQEWDCYQSVANYLLGTPMPDT